MGGDGGAEEGTSRVVPVGEPDSLERVGVEEGGLSNENRSPLDPETVAIKRVIALEGDVVKTRKPYPMEIVTVPEGQLWVEGDEGFHSIDSNCYGPVITSPFRSCCGAALMSE